AVEHPPDVPLQILAGPGSGKTRVLTTRIAYLISKHGFAPSSICAVTFTNKAANEMRERLTKLLGSQRTSEIRMGTFHALCAMSLRRYATSVGLESNFTVCDADESKKIVGRLLKTYNAFLEEKNISLKEGVVLSMISKAKAKGTSAEEMLATVNKGSHKLDPLTHVVAEIYAEYQSALRKSNSLDFDDLLVYGVKLFKWNNGQVVRWCKHVLVDEFQDTNTTQYELMMRIAAAHRCVTIVGDPDQSIYGWRSAEVENLAKMRKDFPATKEILLEQNYRSTGSILAASLAIVEQDKTRIRKSLRTTHPTSTLPVLQQLPSEQMEAQFIALEIKRLVAEFGGALNWSDFAVLLRFSALSRTVESALQKQGIPSRVLGGHKFFDRVEVKDTLAYLQLVDNHLFVPAFMRVVNVPARGIGEKTVAELILRASRLNISPLQLLEKIHDGRTPDIKPPVKRKIGAFVTAIRRLRESAQQGASPADLIRQLLDLTGYEEHLRKTHDDFDTRMENIEELINFAAVAQTTPLRVFLQASMLSTDSEAQDEQSANEKVTISTCHAAKGLEWPVVMIPAVENGVFPFYRSEDTEEERRLLYVACTRAQGFLYLTHVSNRMAGGEAKKRELSEFISVLSKAPRVRIISQIPLFLPHSPRLATPDRVNVARMLGRQPPDERQVARRVAD
ncbi:UvrD-helicase-domain-containing protein, partial [Punctularia strigosozonata HHB-11173 SS5]|uniref:UvrD-helicase-domain-containing protein n=1 Tax=Punctularia strigosozonata (strain HHB-11173) TaxID=741275 RepID=UPI00044181F5